MRVVADLVRSSTTKELLQIVAAELSRSPPRTGLSLEEITRLRELLGDSVVDNITAQFGGSITQRSGMRFDEFARNIEMTEPRNAQKLLNQRRWEKRAA
jgi:hypothetical protein